MSQKAKQFGEGSYTVICQKPGETIHDEGPYTVRWRNPGDGHKLCRVNMVKVSTLWYIRSLGMKTSCAWWKSLHCNMSKAWGWIQVMHGEGPYTDMSEAWGWRQGLNGEGPYTDMSEAWGWRQGLNGESPYIVICQRPGDDDKLYMVNVPTLWYVRSLGMKTGYT